LDGLFGELLGCAVEFSGLTSLPKTNLKSAMLLQATVSNILTKLSIFRATQALGAVAALLTMGKQRLGRDRTGWKLGNLLTALPALCAMVAVPLVLASVLLLSSTDFAHAGTEFCSDYKKHPEDTIAVVDGNDPYVKANLPSSSFTIDMNCEFRNFMPPAWPDGLTPTLNFKTSDKSDIYLIVFDNVWFNGNMACANIAHKLWAVNSYGFKTSCQNIMLPAETIDKLSPAATANVGEPFTYRLTLPAMNFPAGDPSPNDIGSIRIEDDLTAMGVDLTLQEVNAYYKDSGTPVPITHQDDSTVKYLHFNLPNIDAGQQVVIEMTVVLEDTPSNTPGKLFVNTAKWWFSRWIDLNENGIQEPNEFFNPLPGEWGISAPMTIVAPSLVVNKTSPATALNIDDIATFTIDIQNAAGGDAWNVTITDKLPEGMCIIDPTASLSATIVQANGDLVKTLAPGIDYLVFPGTYSGGCEFGLTTTDAAGPIAPEQRLVITYQMNLDPEFTDDGALLTNIAGATRWFSANSTHSGRREFVRSLTNGTPGTIDHEDSYTVTAALHGYYFDKTVQNLTSLANPAKTAAPGDQLRYRLRVFNVDQKIEEITIRDTLNLNYLDPATFGNVQILVGEGYNATHSFDPVTGLLQINGAPLLNVMVRGELVIEFDITLRPGLVNNTEVSNQAILTAADGFNARSDDPHVNGVASPDVDGDEDPTVVVIQTPGPLSKVNGQDSVTIGEHFRYTITVPAQPSLVPLYDVRILDDLSQSAADLRFVSAQVVSGGTWTLSNTGTDTSLIIDDTITGIDIPANGQAVIEITVELLNTAINQSGLTFHNSASYTYNRRNGDDGTQMDGGAGSSGNMTVVEPVLTMLKTVNNVTNPGAPAVGGDTLEYSLTISNSGNSAAHDVNVTDILPAELAFIAGSATAEINGGGVIILSEPLLAAPNTLIWGRDSGDALDITVGGVLVLTYRVIVQEITAAAIANSAWVDWTSLDGVYPYSRERTGDGCGLQPIVAPDDYCYGPETAIIDTIDTNAISKAVTNDTWNTGLSTEDDAIARVGDIITYELTLTLREGRTRNVSITDVLDPGLAFVEVVSINAGANFTYGQVTTPTVDQTGTLTWTLGDIFNEVDNDPTNDTLVIVYRARVQHGPTEAPAPTPTTTALTNQATLGYTYADGVTPVPLDPTRMQDSASLEVRQPAITAITKNGTVAGPAAPGDGTQATPYVVDILNNSMNFSLQACNTGEAPAYGVTITDQLAAELDEQSVSTPVVSITGFTGTPDYTYIAPSARPGLMEFTLNTPLDPGACVTIIYSVGFHTDTAPDQIWFNGADIGQYWSLPPNDAREYIEITPVPSSRVWMANGFIPASPTKILASPASAEATIGEEVVYTIIVPGEPVNAALSNVIITDTLDARLEYLGFTQLSGPAVTDNSIAPSLRYSVAQIQAGEQVVIQVAARVSNRNEANSPDPIDNFVSYDYAGAVAPVTSLAPATVTIVEPLVAVQKTVAPLTSPSVDDILTYALTLTASGGAVGDNYSNAYDLRIVDTLSLGLAYVDNSAVVAGTPINPSTISGDGSTSPQVLTWAAEAIDLDIPEGTQVTVTYQVRVLDSGPNQILRNNVRIEWTSLDGPSDYERTGTEMPAHNDYFATAFTELRTPAVVLLKETTQDTASIGELFSYRITVPATPQITPMYDVRIIDDLTASAADLTFVSVTRISGSQPWSPVNTGDAKHLVIQDTVNGIDIPAGEQVVIEITVVLDDSAANIGGLIFNNTAEYHYNAGNNDNTTEVSGLPGTSGDMTIVGPYTVTLEKTGPATMRVGLPGTFTVNVQNTGTGTAWDLTITDILPNPTPGGMCDAAPTNITAQIFEADGVTTVSPVLVQGSDYVVGFNGDPDCTFIITMQSATAAIGPDQRLIVNYEASLDIDSVGDTTLTNVAAATEWFSAEFVASPGGVVTRLTYNGLLTDGTVGILDEQDAHTLITESPVLQFRKTVSNVTNPALGTSANPGDTLRYTLRVENISDVNLPAFAVIDDLDFLNYPGMFVAGTLTIISTPPGADPSNTNPNGGAKGTGLLDIRNMSLDAQGGANASVDITFEVTLAPVITSGTVVLNQALLTSYGVTLKISDDPNLPGDEDPTETVIISAPVFEVQKTSTIMEGDLDKLMAGETLRYTITVKNIGTEDAYNVLLRDYVPANTSYKAGSTTLNGNPVNDPSPGVSPLQAGILVNAPAPEDSTPGYLRADADPAATNVATVIFEVVVDPAAMDGLIIENQGFVWGEGAGSGTRPEQPSDDPATPIPDDPTRNVVGNLPLLAAQKTVQIHEDFGSPGIVDPGDALRYTIVINNQGAAPANGVVLTDQVPTNTTYIADSLRLNGLPVYGDLSPLIAGLTVQSSDNPSAGIISAGDSAVITFEVRVDAGAIEGTVIRNQGMVTSNELPDEPTDEDGNPANGHQPTVIVVGAAQQLTITKEVVVLAPSGVAEPGSELEYVIRVRNTGSMAAINVVITDDLSPPLGDLVSYVAGSGTLNGSPNGVSYFGSVLTADFASTYGELPPGALATLRFRVQIDPAAPLGTLITNTAVVGWNNPVQTASADVTIPVGYVPGSGRLNGIVWHDADLNKLNGAGEQNLQGWTVELYYQNALLKTTTTDANGAYTFSGLLANEGLPDTYELRFVAPGAGLSTAMLGHGDSPFINGPQRISGISFTSGGNLQNLNLPLSPNGVVYDSVRRTPITGARLTLLNATTRAPLPSQCFDDPGQQNQITAQDGFYKFDLNFSSPSCQPGAAYLIDVRPPAAGYMATPSVIIPPIRGEETAPFSVPACPGSADDAIPATAEFCEVTASAAPPPSEVPPRTQGTIYHLHLTLSDGLMPVENQLFNNHIPVDHERDESVTIRKKSSLINVTKGQLVPYTITVNNGMAAWLYDLAIIDRFPAGFKYVEGSARLNGEPHEPRINGRELLWDNLELPPTENLELRLLLIVGAGVSEGKYVNRALLVNTATSEQLDEDTETVRVIPDPTFDCTDVVGKVFDDRNLNGWQDSGEKGLAGVRLVTARGLIATTDEHGRFHITCAVVPDEDRGSNFILKLDDRSLPTGYRLTTENPRVQRATRGKMMKFNFGATIHRVVGLDIADGVFEPNTTELRPQWEPKIRQLIMELKKAPAVLRLSYLADIEKEGLVRARLEALKKEIAGQWELSAGDFRLIIETEVFWRRGAPPKRGTSAVRQAPSLTLPLLGRE
jgi:uncharacterized repeat protein (TIGR01451 family)/fimbrial isopeptide formation D2 family protein